MTSEPGNYLLALRQNAQEDADRLEREAEALEAKAHAMRMEAFQMRATLKTLGRFG